MRESTDCSSENSYEYSKNSLIHPNFSEQNKKIINNLSINQVDKIIQKENKEQKEEISVNVMK